MDESRTRALLTRVVAEAPPPAAVDIDRIIELAQARDRDRTRWVIAAAAAVLVVVVVAVTTLTLGGSAERAAPPAGPMKLPIQKLPAENPHASIPQPGSVPVRFDLMRSELLVSNVPDSLYERGTSVRYTTLGFYAIGRGPNMTRNSVSIVLGSRGTKLNRERGNKIVETRPGPSINGHPSTLNKWDDPFGWQLLWNWAPDAEAEVDIEGLPNPEQLAAKIATAVRVNFAGHARLPFTLRAPTGALLSEFQATIDLSSGKGRKPSATVAFAGPGSGFISINANPLGTGIGKPDSVYEDRPARIKHERSGNGQGGTFSTMIVAADDLKITGTCNWNPNPEVTEAEFKKFCLSTTASVQRVGNFRNAADWPIFTVR
ncbi:hypothetical protein [Cryptosporangium phraense]|uniref:Uncharacterized protein n=1 Tax=Cryptosporangium phraense TaxID=2593070 RepID=A0A545AZR8_9ACTN|nr:hypothetical protein [Cryptosporangium phraense]TQS46817.1 hypothetical protein FL583_00625 [Cryptosporangium phraense]